MQSQGSTSTQPSFDSLSSSDSLLLSDSEQAEDDTDVFLTDSSVITGGAGGAKAKKDLGLESPRSQWDSFIDKEEEEESYRSESNGKHLGHDDSMSQKPKSEGDLLFAQKCAELQGFVKPLLELLNGLKKGRFDHGLSSFQQSVAMDRIQRIVGVLQRPDCGEKYLNTLLQVEAMLKLWFPQISAQSVTSSSCIAVSPMHPLQDTSSSMPLHKHKDQSHIPVKKRRLSWTDTDSPAPSPVPTKCPRVCAGKRRVTHNQDARAQPSSCPLAATEANLYSPDVVCNSQLNFGSRGNDSENEEPDNPLAYRATQNSEPRLTWVHVAPIPSPRKACLSNEGPEMESSRENVPALGRRGSPAMQDSSISSTTPPSMLPKPQKKTIQRQNQPVFGQQGGRETTGTCQGQNQSPPFTLKPVPRVSPST